jgi:predicted ATPase/class 3 adenylate cyclase
VHDAVTTFLFTDIEGSTRLWEQEPERMRPALARHDAIVRTAVESHGGTVVKMTGDGVHAAFAHPIDAVLATLELQRALASPHETIALQVRCGIHAGPSEGRDNDFYGSVVNRAARIMSAAHGGQVLVSHAVSEHVARKLPDGVLLRDLGNVRLRDLASAERLYQLVASGLREEFPPLRSLEDTPNNLPQALSSFVGRERDIAKVRGLLEAHRLVTLVGMGGIGKTRLSLHVGAESLEDHADGVWLVELGLLHEPHRVPLAVAATLGVREEGGHAVEQSLARHVKDRALLVVLDNCEHLLDSAAGVAKLLLSAGAGVRVLATSREPLRIAGESTYVMSGLAVPGPREALAPGAVAQYESVRLFVDRASAASPGFELSAENATPVAAICHRLDGIPLAIELAAARARSISIPQIAARLKDRFRLLTAGDPTALPRQRTLRAMIDWSHDLLSQEERALFRRLGVFVGGWTLEAAEEICALAEVRAESILDLLSLLVEKSLVVFDEASQRYRMLDTVREYAVEQLAASQDAPAIGDRHLQYFLAFAESAKPQLAGPHQLEWLARVDAERENIIAAHEWAGRAPQHALAGLRLVHSVKMYWINRGMLELGHRVTVEALARDGSREPNLPRAQGLFSAGQYLYFMGKYTEARVLLSQSLEIARHLGDGHGVAAVLQPLGMAAIGEGDLSTARACLEEALAITEASGNQRSLPGALNALACLHRVEGRSPAAGELLERVVAVAEQVGNSEWMAMGLLNRAMLAVDQLQPGVACEHLAKALSVARAIHSAQACQGVLDVCAGLAMMQGDAAACARFLGASHAQAVRSGLRREPADEKFLEPWIARARSAMGDKEFANAEAEGASLSYERSLALAQAWAARSSPHYGSVAQSLTIPGS